MEAIVTVNTWTKDDKTKVIINNTHFVSPGMIKNVTGLTRNYYLLVGSKVEVEYFVTGDVIKDELICTKDNTIVKGVEFELSEKLQEYAMKAAFAD